jgi:NADH:ubiquinone oxidoreductase subunit F (NADH-binding)/(2Fe-2S) ferredoxin
MPKLSPADLDALRAKAIAATPAAVIKVGLSTCGVAAGAQAAFQLFTEQVKAKGLQVVVQKTGCAGMCALEPLVEVALAGQAPVMYGAVTTEAAQRILDQHVIGGRPVADLKVPSIGEMGVTAHGATNPQVVPGQQYRIVMRNCGVINPESIDEYIARDGYQALKKVLGGMTPEQVVDELKISGLRGRGGAGFPTWMKWDLTRKSPASNNEKFIICNGDEGDPGAYMDRSVLEGDPHAVVEGMILGGWVIGAKQGIFYIRAEYPLAIERIEKAIKQARVSGLLGKGILGTAFDFDLEVRLGAGAFVCGEETALIASVEGKRGTPRPRPPYPSVRGLFDAPTMINNVETLANIAAIILRGGSWFGGIGSDKSKGTKVFAVTGKVKHAGLVEIPMGTTLRQIVMGICGGTASGKPIKAVQTGGPSGGLIPAHLLDTPVTYEHLQQLGSIMGSGGMIVMEEGDSVDELAQFYLGFCVDESCAKCAPCRIGGTQMLGLLDKVVARKGTAADITTVRRVAQAMQKASLCALGQTAPNPVLSALKYFPGEFDERLQPVAPAMTK